MDNRQLLSKQDCLLLRNTKGIKNFITFPTGMNLRGKIILGPVHANQVDTLETKIFFTRIETFRPHDADSLIETASI